MHVMSPSKGVWRKQARPPRPNILDPSCCLSTVDMFTIRRAHHC